MSTILEKAWDSLGSLFTPFGTNVSLKHMLEKCLDARTKKEEEWLVIECLKDVKARLEGPSNTPSTIARCLAFVIFAETLGYKCKFAHIHAVKLAQFGSLTEKKMGYSSCIFLLQKSDPLAVLAINTIMRDLASKNILLVGMALSASCYLIPTSQAPSVLPLLVEKLSHQSEFVRSKAVIALHHFLRTCPVHCCHYIDSVGACLGDKDPGVVGFVLQFLLDASKVDSKFVKNFVPVLITIQQQLIAGKLSQEYVYQGLSAPWMQITLLRLFQSLDEFPAEVISATYETLQIARKRSATLIGEALVIECINILIHCKTKEHTLELAMAHVSELLSSTNNNLRYAGLDLLQTILHHFQFPLPSELQGILLTCLEHTDPSFKHKTLNLLCVAANHENVDVICSQVADYAHSGCERNMHLRGELVKEAVMLTDKFPNSSNYWHVAMLIRLLPLANQIQSRNIQRRIKCALLSETSQNMKDIQQKVLKILKKYSSSKTASISVLEIFVWTLSNFGLNFDDSTDPHSIAEEIILLGRKVLKHHPPENSLQPEIVCLLLAIIDALMHLMEQYGISLSVQDFLEEVKSAAVGNLFLLDSCTELLRSVSVAQEICHHLKNTSLHSDHRTFDFTLSFLDEYVCKSLEGGGQPYCPKVPKPLDLEGLVSARNRETFSKTLSIQPSSSDCTSPVSSELESCFGSLSSEDSKIWPVRRKEIADVKLVWTKTGRVQEENFKDCDISKILDVPSTATETVANSRTSHEQHTRSGELCIFGTSDESRDPLDALLNKDFQKLSVS